MSLLMKNRNVVQPSPTHKNSAWIPLFALALLCGLGPVSANAQNGTWISLSSGHWTFVTNWLNNQEASGSAYTAFFNALDITNDPTIVHLGDAAVSIGTMVFGDLDPVTSPAGWYLDYTGPYPLTLAGPTNIVVNALGAGKQVTFNGNLAGTSGLRKTGAGNLDLSGSNALTAAWR